jgi:Flp pilus assembly protein TadG
MPTFRSRRGRAHIPACRSISRRCLILPATECEAGDRQRGSVALELVLVTPLVLVLIVFVVFCGRVARAEAIVRDAASAGARAASLRQKPATARADAVAAVHANLSSHRTTCPSPRISVDTSGLRPGGQVAVQVTCEPSLSDLALLGLPGSRRISERSVEVVDVRRGG